MLKIFLYLIEGFIIGYFDFKFIKKDFNYYLISLFSIIFTLSHVIAEEYLVYDYLSIVITIAILYLMNGLDNKIDKTKNLFISTFIGIVICMFDSMSILKIIFVLKTGNEGVWYSQDIVYYIILVATRLMIFITLYLLDKKQIFKQLIISNKYLTLLTSISLVNCLITSFIANGIYMNSISYGYVYLLAIIFMVTIISVFIIILSINKDNMRIKKQEIELIQLKSIEEKYIAVQSQNKRNEEIKHDLEYFMSLVNKKSDCDELTKTLKNTINKIDQNHIKVYSKNKIFNGLLEKIKDTANKYNQQVLYNLNVGLIEFPLQDYESVLTLFQEICQNNETKKIDINVNVKNGFMIIEFIFKPKKEMEYEVNNRYILKEKNCGL
ncbi:MULTISPECIES: hypothetical protein [unclassified Faecalibacillus]|uniref:hypothetical protein n=1 Tax=unclassified Faecalibacillus TaxID=2678890 RepID=UPI001D0B483A|nr:MULTISPECIES: hypothetical protein [unclassified Faecalibacillus]MCB8540775.1 hypothetical protein [Faecalibacillus sp. TM498]MCB8558461.1 hypothetical protein [Faecalibacillus sp. TM111]